VIGVCDYFFVQQLPLRLLISGFLTYLGLLD